MWAFCAALVLVVVQGQPLASVLSALGANQWDVWMTNVSLWAGEALNGSGYVVGAGGNAYEKTSLEWVQSAALEVHLPVSDRYLITPSVSTGVGEVPENVTVDRWLGDFFGRYGTTPDVLVLWMTIPWVGIDDRSQVDHALDIPGTNETVKLIVDGFRHGTPATKLLLGIGPWDNVTNSPIASDCATWVSTVDAFGMDGMYFLQSGSDRTDEVASDCLATRTDGHWLALETDGRFPIASSDKTVPIARFPLSRGLWWSQNTVEDQTGPPLYSSYHQMERRHRIAVGTEFDPDPSWSIRVAFLNAGRITVMENTWTIGVWPWSPRNTQLARRATLILRQLGPLISSTKSALGS